MNAKEAGEYYSRQNTGSAPPSGGEEGPYQPRRKKPQVAASQSAAGQPAQTPTPGVFTLDQLHALGQTGDPEKDWLRSSGGGSLFAGGGHALLGEAAKNLPAGYYRIPGVSGAEYYDPRQGQASAEFINWANGLTADDRDPFSGVPKNFIPAEGGPEAANAARMDQSPGDIATFNKIISGGKGPDGTYQESQDRVLGLGKYQQFMLDANGKQVRVSDVLSAAPGKSLDRTNTPFINLSRDPTGAFDRLSKLMGLSGRDLDEQIGLTGSKEGRSADYWMRMENTLASNYETRLEQARGLREGRIARGENPETGISAEETKRIYETYMRIEDPAQRAAYIQVQDPGNLTPNLREERKKARAWQTDLMSKNQFMETTWESSKAYGDVSGTGGGVKTTYGGVTVPDKETGRETHIFNIPTKREYVAPEARGAFDMAMHRLGGGIYGTIMGFISSFGNPYGALMGGASGSGLMGGINFKKPGKSKWGAAQTPGSIQDIAVSLGTAMAFARFGVSKMGFFQRIGIGAGIGSVSGSLQSGGGDLGKKMGYGALQGGFAGAFSRKAGPSWRDKIMKKAGAKFYFRA